MSSAERSPLFSDQPDMRAPQTSASSTRAEVWHACDASDVVMRFASSRHGLRAAEAARRLEADGPNRLPQAARRGALTRLLMQFHNLLIYVLLAAAVLAGLFGHAVDAAVILAVVVLNAAIGFIQEGRAEKALEAIKSMIDPHASVIREGRRLTVAADEIVRGDIVVLEAGDRVPADLRLIRTRNLRVEEAVLTGESAPVDKAVEPVAADAALGDRSSMAFSGTLVVAGLGVGVVTGTAGATELGRVSAMLGAVEQLTTPLVRQMDQFARQITIAVLAGSILIFAYAILVQSYPLAEAFMVVVGLAVAAIPEGLPAVLTITLAIGVLRMARKNAIIRRLPAVETLGSVSVICSDKTGTLTRNEMAVLSIALAAGTIEVESEGYRPLGAFRAGGASVDPASDPVLRELALAGMLCNDAELRHADGEWVVDGDPMEGALLSLANKAGFEEEVARSHNARIDEIPFDARYRYMATLHSSDRAANTIFVKGAPERIFAMCSTVATADGVTPLDREEWLARIDALASQGQRVIALARGEAPAGSTEIRHEDIERGLVLLGLVGLIDPPRAEAREAIGECRSAGIRVKMITGDHLATARAIALQLGLADKPQTVTGYDLDHADDAQFGAIARDASVFARTSPEHKLRLVEAMQADGMIVAMTGDGVNDAPALKRADVGVAMGRKGTEAAKEASEMVLADDNFASIVAAVREGRTVYDNLQKVIAWTLPTNGGEALTIILAIAFGLTLPVTAIQILWINLVTAVALGLTLAFEPTEPGAMQRPPRGRSQVLLSPRLAWRIGFVSVLIVCGSFGIYAWAGARGLPIEAARTMVVNTIVVMEIFYLFSVRYSHGTALTWQGVIGTPAVLIGVTTVCLAQLAFTYLPPLQAVFDTRPVALWDGVVIVLVGVGLLLIVEIEKRIATVVSSMHEPRPTSGAGYR